MSSPLRERREAAMGAVRVEIARAMALHPVWPDDVVYAAATVAEEAGELVQAALDVFDGTKKIDSVRREALHTAATSIRLLMNLEELC